MEQAGGYKRGERGGGDWFKEGEEISQRTYVNDPWTGTMVWGLTREWGSGWGEWAKGEKLGQL